MCLAIPGKITSIQEDTLMPLAKVTFGGALREVNLAYTPEAKIGDYVIVHVGFAISILNEQEAQRIYEALDQLPDPTNE